MDLMVQKYRFDKERVGVTEINGGVWQKKVMSKKNQGLQHMGGKRRK